ncbi:MAG: LD-carboxypeptidase [Bacteroidetes bacterium]|nr:LD-carboxypeptidase [Bacteroidota bacterium]
MNQILLPPFLQPGDCIGITCPAGYVAPERVAFCEQVLQGWGFRVHRGKTIGTGDFYFSGNDAERLADLQEMLDDPGLKAILAGRGGYGCSRIVDALDWTHFLANPKWICGFSDITVLHSHVHQQLGVASLHSPMCGAFKPETEHSFHIESFRRALTGLPLKYSFPASAYNRPGLAEGVLVGGNLALLAHLTGSCSQLQTRDKILFIEDIGEHLYQIDRMLLSLKRSGQLQGISALLVGQFSELEDTERPFGQSLEALILDKLEGISIPVAFGLPCGHETENITLRLGTNYRLESAIQGYSLLSAI